MNVCFISSLGFRACITSCAQAVIILGLAMLLNAPAEAAGFFEDVGGAISEGLKKGNEELTNAGRTANTEITNAGTKANTEITSGLAEANTSATGVLTEANTAVTGVLTEANKGAAEQLATTNADVANGLQQSWEQANKIVNDVSWNIDKAGKDVEAETGRFGKNLETAGQAIGHFLERTVQGTGQTLSNAEKRVREGKVIDALWHLGTDPLQNANTNAALAATESEYLNTVAQVAATAYGGGSAGAAAYAAWLTYNQTGSADMALRAGILTYATSEAFKTASAMPSDTSLQIAQKTAVTASIGGIAVAAAGGDESAIKEGFLRAGGMVLVQDGYKKVTGTELDTRSSKGEAYCMTAVGADCSPPESAYVRDSQGNIMLNSKGDPIIDMSKIDPRVPHVGEMGGAGTASWKQERSVFMTSVSRIPGINAMSVFHDQWAISWDMGTITLPTTIIPAVVLTYTGTGAPYYELLRKTSVVGDQNESRPAAAAVQPPADSTANGNVFVTDSALASIACERSNLSKSIVVDFPAKKNGMCEVVLVQPGQPLSIIGSAHTGSECMKMAGNYTQAQIASGASCFVRETAKLASGDQIPKQLLTAVNEQNNRPLPSISLKTIGIIFIVFLIMLGVAFGYSISHVQHRIRRGRVNAV
ncbi:MULTISPECIES: hypothetical protein [unclassified Pseudomonas]|uniref:hypothetical protein n=1 Tax=unclassified Pseudomonas TaxID=196821 RepID=UPI001CBE7C5D|nr:MULTISPECIES: hypothetical protein [unclassified Pseudomonas]